ncbi:MAG: ethanolamine ammonia-lyase subunit EutC [Planctomycetia bacterium]|nr:ethanolamine ammonia-lyase subunit EutC [Planctomycetia bacterium]
MPHELDEVDQTLQCTSARLFTGRAGLGYRTATALKLRADHAAARDAVYQFIDLKRDIGEERLQRWGLFGVTTQVRSRTEYLMRPDRGRVFDVESQETIKKECTNSPTLQIVLGDGLSAAAVIHHGVELLDLLHDKAKDLSWSVGKPFCIRFCRVGIMSEIGRLLNPELVILLIGERPGLAHADSLSAYLAYRPQAGHTDAQRNLISNIHAQGIPTAVAAERIMELAIRMREAQYSGVMLKEQAGNKLLSQQS